MRLIKLRQNGFTLVEVMVVVVIMAILAAIVVPKIISRPEQAKVVKAKQDITEIENAMELYKLDNGSYPTQEQGIQALVTKPTTSPIPPNWEGYLKTAPVDPWGKPYHYQIPGKQGDIDIFTYGPTGKSGGTGKNATIGSWNLQSAK